MISKVFVACLLFFFMISAAYAVLYVDPTPEEDSKMAIDEIEFKAFDENSPLSDCSITINDVSYPMAYASGICTYVIADPPATRTTYTFQIFYNSSSYSLAERTFTYFPTPRVINEVPFAHPVMMIVGLLAVLGLLRLQKNE